MKVQVKICGIRSINSAKVAIESGADFLGFNFVPTSNRYINPDLALAIINLVRGKVKTVGVFQDADISNVKKIIYDLNLDFVQLHGSENNMYINNVGIPVIKSIKEDDNIENIKADYFLLDRTIRGEGQMTDFQKAAKIATHHPLFYAGGLTTQNVIQVVKDVHPFAVDVAGGIETNGVEDLDKIKSFIKTAKEINI